MSVRTWRTSSSGSSSPPTTTWTGPQRGIVYIDEIDKIARKSENPSITPMSPVKRPAGPPQDPRGTVANVPPQVGQDTHQEFIQVDTPTALHLRGAFVGLDKSSRAG